jgi:hypothetical protein
MVVDKPITVTSSQFDHILSVAQPLAAGQREAYAVDVATSLQGQPIGDGSVGRAVREAFATHFHPARAPQGAVQLGGQVVRTMRAIVRLTLEPIREVLESDESDVIPCWALDSLESARCGSPNNALSRTAVAYVTRAI